MKKIYCIVSISEKRLSSLFICLIFIPFPLLFYSFFPTFFVLILSYLSGTCTFLFADISGRNFPFFWTFLSGTFFPGGGGVHVHPVHPPCVRAWSLTVPPPISTLLHGPSDQVDSIKTRTTSTLAKEAETLKLYPRCHK